MPAKKSATTPHAVEKTDIKPDAVEDDTVEPEESEEENTQEREELELVTKELEQVRQELADKQDKLLRAYADFQNYQKRMEKELASREQDIRRRYLVEILDFYELLKKAADDPRPQDGIKSLLSTIDHFLAREGVHYLDCRGKPFDYKVQHALSTIENEECPEGTVVEEVKKGYLLGDTLLRPAQVIVSTKKESSK
jgi:molecular chaperone GrpE